MWWVVSLFQSALAFCVPGGQHGQKRLISRGQNVIADSAGRQQVSAPEIGFWPRSGRTWAKTAKEVGHVTFLIRKSKCWPKSKLKCPQMLWEMGQEMEKAEVVDLIPSGPLCAPRVPASKPSPAPSLEKGPEYSSRKILLRMNWWI